MSLGTYGNFIELNYYSKFNSWSVMNKPTSDAWIDPFVKHLKNIGVIFHNNSSLEKIIVEDKSISYCIVNSEKKYSQIHVIALNPFEFEKVIINSNLIQYFPNYSSLNTINNQISFRIGFNNYINIINEKEENSFVLMDSPYNITFYPQEEFWCNTSLGTVNNKPIKVYGVVL